MGIKDISNYIKKNTNACHVLPYELLAGEHIVVDGNEFIFKYVTPVFGNVSFASLPPEAQNLNDWQLVDFILDQNWESIIRNMQAGVRRYPPNTYITFIMDGEDITGSVTDYDALGGMFELSKTLKEDEVLYDNYESSSEDEIILATDNLDPVFIVTGNRIPSIDTSDLKADTWEERKEKNDKYSKSMRSGYDISLSGLFRMTNLAKCLISDLVEQTKDRIMDVIYANGEADFLVALYCNEGKAFACVSRDSDQLAYGSYLQVIKADHHGLHVRYIPFILHDLGITVEQLRQWCILLGVDYNERIKGMGPVTSLRIVKGQKEWPDQEKLDVIARFSDCWDIFSSARGYNYIDNTNYSVDINRLHTKVLTFLGYLNMF